MILTTFAGVCTILGLSVTLGLLAGCLTGFFGMCGVFLALCVHLLENAFKSQPGLPLSWMTLYSTLDAAAAAPFLVAAWGHLRRVVVERDGGFAQTAAIVAMPAVAAFLFGYETQVGAFSLMFVVLLLDCLGVPCLLRFNAPTRVAAAAAAVWFCFFFGHVCRVVCCAHLKYFADKRNFPDLFWDFNEIARHDVHVLTMLPFACAAALGAWFGVRWLYRLAEEAQRHFFRAFLFVERAWLLLFVLILFASLGAPFS